MRKIVIFQLLLIVLFVGFPSSAHSKGVEFTKGEELPKRIIRACCSFGSNVGIVGIPYFKVTEITGVENIGKHHYLGSKSEGNGIIYTIRGGFIDLAHLRDQADWTAYLYHMIEDHKGENNVELKLGYEGGMKKLIINVPDDLLEENCMILAGRIAYDLAVWHEIATWFGAESVPFISEQYSSFSIEDDYSNLLGVTLGIEALKSNLPYEEAVTKLLDEKLIELGRVDSVSQTYDAMERVLNKWWTRDFKFPQANVILKREFSNFEYCKPLIVPGFGSSNDEVCIIQVPELKMTTLTFDDLYTFQVRLNGKFLARSHALEVRKRIITNHDFLGLIDEINIESNEKLSKISKNYQL